MHIQTRFEYMWIVYWLFKVCCEFHYVYVWISYKYLSKKQQTQVWWEKKTEKKFLERKALDENGKHSLNTENSEE